VDVTTLAGRFFVLEVRKEILLDQQHRIRFNFHDYVQYKCQKDFPSRIELLAMAGQDLETEHAPAPLSVKVPHNSMQEADEEQRQEMDVRSKPEFGQIPEAETRSAASQVDLELQPIRKQGGLLAAPFGRRE